MNSGSLRKKLILLIVIVVVLVVVILLVVNIGAKPGDSGTNEAVEGTTNSGLVVEDSATVEVDIDDETTSDSDAEE